LAHISTLICKADIQCSPILILPPDKVALVTPQYLHLVFHDVVHILPFVRKNYCATATSHLAVMTNYLLPAHSSYNESTQLSKSLASMIISSESLDASSLLIPTFIQLSNH